MRRPRSHVVCVFARLFGSILSDLIALASISSIEWNRIWRRAFVRPSWSITVWLTRSQPATVLRPFRSWPFRGTFSEIGR